MSDRIFNFSAGPAVLPEEVLKRSRGALWELDDTGIGILECSHRGGPFIKILEETERRCRHLAGIPDDYSVLFLQGGASTQFFMVPMNFLPAGQTADYLFTGSWSEKAAKEAKILGGNVHKACSSEDKNYSYIPAAAEIKYSDKPAYVHFTSNNTIFGTEWREEPPGAPAGVPLICDASSDIFSRPIDIKKYGLIYAGAQKNLGPAGLTLVIIRKDLVASGPKNIPTMMQYRTHAENDSCYNTPPTFAIYVLNQVLGWLEEVGGLEAIAEQNRAKARLIYDYLDSSKFFKGTARADSRSLMNICFRGPNEELEKKFISAAEKQNLDGLKGHRSVGGMRASIYNAFPKKGCEALVDFMRKFEKENS